MSEHDGRTIEAAFAKAESDADLALKAARDWPGLRLLMMWGLTMERQQAHGIGQLAMAVLQKPAAGSQFVCREAERSRASMGHLMTVRS
mgnify:CR=1 FL=1